MQIRSTLGLLTGLLFSIGIAATQIAAASAQSSLSAADKDYLSALFNVDGSASTVPERPEP